MLGRGRRTGLLAMVMLGAAGLSEAQTPQAAAPAPAAPPVPPPPPPAGELKGFADLHVHPATHFSFGRNGGEEGLFWGKPGMAFADAPKTIANDLRQCAGAGDPNLVGSISHGLGADFDMVRHGTHQMMISALDASTGFSHSKFGAPGYESWPNARSLLHEQMHVTMLHRAWEGGLRLIVAAAMDAQLMARIWENGMNLGAIGIPHADARFDLESAKRQLTWIKQFARANAAWMEVVRTSEEARRAIQAGKLAVVLGVEMDSLTGEQILDLVKNHDVRSAIPVHLADNPAFGGTAVYNDLFNTSTQYLTGHFLRVEGDPNLSARLSADTSTLEDPGGLAGFLNAKIPTALKRGEYCNLGYECCQDIPHTPCVPRTQGHKNATGLTASGDGELVKLMKAGVIVDIVHMGEKATEGALRIAERFNYPVMNSHSGVRDEHKCAENERAMRFDHARRMAKLGGVFGLGTEGNTQPTTLLDESMTPIVRFTGNLHNRGWNLRMPRRDVIDQVKFEIRTGGDDLRDAKTAYGVLDLGGGKKDEFALNADSGWSNDSNNTILHDVDIRPQDLKGVGVHTTFGGGMGGDNWNMNRVVVSVRINGKWTIVATQSGSPFVRFTGDRHDWTQGVNVGNAAMLNTCAPNEATLAADALVARVSVTIKTGGDDLRGGNDNAWGTVALADGKKWEFPLNRGVQWQNGAIVTVLTTVPEGTRVRDLKSFSIRTNFTGGIAGDNWNVDRVTVQALGDPIPNWIKEHQEVVGLMGRPGAVSFGSDMNGLAPQFPFSLRKVKYPLDVARKQGVNGARDLSPDKLGSRTFELSQDGVAHIGLFPELLGAIAEAPRGDQVVSGMYKSAGEFVEMWRKIEEASKKIK
jgi:microsomal dipeptidase-like Zn-dependent dipeptidase